MFNNKAFSLIELFILLLLISGIAGVIQSNRIRANKNKDEKECFINQQTLINAIEMYKIGKPSKTENNYPGLDYENLEKELLKDEYCLKEPLKPTFKGCSYGYVGENANATVFCKVHGTIKPGRRFKRKPTPEYDESLEKPFSPSYNDFRNKIINEKIKEQKKEEFINTLITISALPGLICIYLLENHLFFIMVLIGIFSTIYWLSLFSNKKKAC